MFNLGFSISNPLNNKIKFRSNRIFYFHKNLSENKSFEIQFEVFEKAWQLIHFNFDVSLGGKDHAGIEFIMSLGPIYLGIIFYDRRHWDHNNNRWELPE